MIKAYDHQGLESTAKDVHSHTIRTQIPPQVADVRLVGVCSMTVHKKHLIALSIDQCTRQSQVTKMTPDNTR